MEKVLTISIAAYNAEKFIKKCLDSLLNTSIADLLDVIVVNDGSKDNTKLVVENYVEQYPNIITLVNKENGGHGSTINTSIPLARGKYYKIVDSDDWVDRVGLEKLIDELRCCEADIIFNPYYEIQAESEKRVRKVVPFDKKQDCGKARKLSDINNINLYMHSMTIKTSVMKNMNEKLDENCFYVDMEYTIFPILWARTYICLEFPVYEYLLGTTTQSMNINNLINRRNQHLKVTKRIISFYNINKSRLKGNKRDLILYRLKLAILSQYKIYFNMDPQESLREIVDFDKWLKKTNLEVYDGPKGRFMKIIKFNRRTSFRWYELISKLMKRMNMEPQL